MEEVEEANRAAVESCYRVINLLSQRQDQVPYGNLMVETGEAVSKFKKVVSLLNNGLGHARVRKVKKLQVPFPQSILLENPNSKLDHFPKTMLSLQPSSSHYSTQELGSNIGNSLSLGKPSLQLSSNGKNPLLLTPQVSSPHYHYHLLQQQQRVMLQQQQMKQQAEMMYRKSNSGMSLNFDSSSCTPNMSSTKSFISSLSIDGSVANLDGTKSAFHLIGAPHSSDQSSQHQKRKCSGKDEGSSKCWSSTRCHCSKKRSD